MVLAGGGTAGHVLPAVAIARALVEQGCPAEQIHFIGAAAGMEATMVPAAGFELSPLRLRNFRRSAHPRNLLAAANLLAGVVRSISRLRRWQAAVVVSVGGYASVPAVVAARVLRRPVVVVSYDAVPGLASRLAARVAAACAVAFETSTLPRRTVTGAPVRAEVLAMDRTRDRRSARQALGLDPDRFVVASVGGSLGSGKINDVMDEAVELWRDRRDLAVRQVIGARNDDGRRVGRDGHDGLQRQVVAFEDQMELLLVACDVLVARAGAATVAEIGAIGVPSVLVPWPGAAGDHQRANARSLSDHGGALLVDDTRLDAAWLVDQVDRFVADPTQLDDLAEAARRSGHRDGAANIATLVRTTAGLP